MHVVALVTQKGGPGRVRSLVSLAVAAQERGLRVYLIDMDPQGTAKNWYERREAQTPEVATIEPSRLPAALARSRPRAATSSSLIRPASTCRRRPRAMQAADLCLIPARPSIADIEATKPTVRSLAKLGRASPSS